MMQYWTLDPPAQWKLGSVGTKPNDTPFYANCADCDAKEPPIAGIISTDGTFAGIGILKIEGSFFVKHAMFCTPCLTKRLDQSPRLHRQTIGSDIDELPRRA